MFRIVLPLIFFLFSHQLKAQAFKNTTTIAEQVEDFKIFKTTLLECHSGIYDYNDSLKLHSSLKSLESKLNVDNLTKLEQLALYSKFTSTLGCIHTTVEHKKLKAEIIKANFKFPFEVYFINNELRSSENYNSSDFIISENDKIISINEELIDNLKDSLYQFISSDGNNTSFKDEVLKQGFLYYYFIYKGEVSDFNLKYIHGGQSLSGSIKPVHNKRKNKSRNIKIVFSFTKSIIDIEKNFALLTLPSPLKISGGYKRELKRFIKKINKLNISNLIIDLRENGGGKTQKYLAGFFIDSTIVYDQHHYKSIKHATFKKNFIKKRKLEYQVSKIFGEYSPPITGFQYYVEPQKQYKGQLYLLINGKTVSASANLASILKNWTNVIIVGQESGGSYKSFNIGGGLLQLPNSKIKIAIRSIKGLNNVPKNQGEGGVIPDFYINRPNELNAENDNQLSFIIEEISHSNNKHIE
ncbi:MAG: S41 family peptidase [Salinivirgaceae bacterium]|nr:S41 family peptidase [Salinivirgaceae bacterium]